MATLQVMELVLVGPASHDPHHGVAEVVSVVEVRTLALVVGNSLRLEHIPIVSLGLIHPSAAFRVKRKTSSNRPHHFSENRHVYEKKDYVASRRLSSCSVDALLRPKARLS